MNGWHLTLRHAAKVVWLNRSACRSSSRSFSGCIGRKCRELWTGCGEMLKKVPSDEY